MGKGKDNPNKRGRTSPASPSSSSSTSPQKLPTEEEQAAMYENWKKQMCEMLDEKCKGLRTNLQTFMVDLIKDMKKKLDMATHWINNKEKQERKTQFVIHGIAEEQNEGVKDTEKKVKEFLQVTLQIPEDEAKDMVGTTFRMGKKNKTEIENQNQTPPPIQKNRPILLKLLRERHRNVLTSHFANLRNTGIKVDSYLLEEERKAKNILMKYRKDQKALGKKVKMLDDNTLVVNGEYYGVKNNAICSVIFAE